MSRSTLIIDALNLFSRHYVRHPGMSTLGHQVGGIVGFLDSIRYMTELLNPEKIIIVWEGGGSSRRRALYPEYKANRRPPRLNRYYEDDIPDSKENRLHQIKFLVDVIKYLPICQLFIEDCEADDVIGYVCKNTFKHLKKVIVSSDRDFYQLLDDDTMIYSLSSKKFIGPSAIIEQFNISPVNFVLAKAICGDSSDAITGVKGIGFKTLAKKFALAEGPMTIDDVMAQAQAAIVEGSKQKIYQQLLAGEEIIRRNWRLMHLDVANLAALQIRKIEAILNSFRPSKDKIKLMRSLIDEGLGAYDAHDLFSAFTLVT